MRVLEIQYSHYFFKILNINMKPIELTAEHKDKLLEMCKVLFPKYKYIIFGSHPGDMIFNKTVTFESEQWLGMDDECYSIHWFEFCINNLLSKLRLTYYNYVRSNMEEGYNHLVDYLYEEFLKLK